MRAAFDGESSQDVGSAPLLRARGFALLEMLVVVAVVGVLLALILPALASAHARAGLEVCGSNLRQWQQAWLMYAQDSGGTLVPNLADSVSGEWRGTRESWAGTHHARLDTATDSLDLGVLSAYLGSRVGRVAQCPGDRSRLRDRPERRARSYSLNGNCHGRTSEWQQVVRRLDDIQRPAELFTFVDEHEDSIDDGHFLVWPAPAERWVNLPAGRHRQHGVWSAADGSVFHVRWRTPRIWSRRGTYWREAESVGERADLAMFQRWSLPSPQVLPDP